jgi:hypothetical protein
MSLLFNAIGFSFSLPLCHSVTVTLVFVDGWFLQVGVFLHDAIFTGDRVLFLSRLAQLGVGTKWLRAWWHFRLPSSTVVAVIKQKTNVYSKW